MPARIGAVIPTNKPHSQFLIIFCHHLVSTSFWRTPHPKAHSTEENARKFAAYANASRDTQRQFFLGRQATARRQTRRRAVTAALGGEMFGEPDGQGDGGKRGVCLSGRSENGATGDMEIGDVDDATVVVDDGVVAVRAHPGQPDLMVAVFGLRGDMLFKIFGGRVEYQLAYIVLLEPAIKGEMCLERPAKILGQI